MKLYGNGGGVGKRQGWCLSGSCTVAAEPVYNSLATRVMDAGGTADSGEGL